MLDEATLLVPDRTICNPIDDFKLGVAALTDTSLGFVASDLPNPPRQSTLNGALTRAGFIQRGEKKTEKQRSSKAWINYTSTPEIPAAEVS